MTSLLEGRIADLIQSGLEAGKLVYDIQFHRDGAIIPPANPWEDPTYGPPIDHVCRGFVDDYSTMLIAQSVVQIGDRKINIVANTLPVVPEPGDKITAQGQTFLVITVKRDPATAMWELQGRS
ncbi:hypothetical protein [Pelagibacterium lentulum]|uniref:Uncharacterized protein n=1 Tax=Pelagibacterium lentulum TaxID=2029865 RepID=A0A916RQL1_9HYPH|nr:hypothetical protein [Pelagibacterium lentulum]GGA64923.1 hypothetical protein GCM10011499_39220 [Pelagibacterium lentulum]